MDKLFEACAIYLLRFKIPIFILITGVFMILSQYLSSLNIDSSIEGFLQNKNPDLITYKKFKEDFGSDEFIFIAFETDDVFNPDFLLKLKNIHYDLEDELDHIEVVVSLFNILNITGGKNELIIEKLLLDKHFREQQLKKIKSEALNNRRYDRLYLSSDGRITSIIVKIKNTSALTSSLNKQFILSFFSDDHDRELNQLVKKTKKIIDRYQTKNIKIHLGGSVTVDNEIKSIMVKNMSRFILLALLSIALLLSLLFKTVLGVVLPLVVVMVSLVSTLGLMGLLSVPLKITGQILPSFLLAVGVGGCIHFLVIFYRFFQVGYIKQDAVVKTFRVVGLPILLSNVTTALGLLSFANAEVAPVAELGIFAAIGIGFSFFYTLFLLPILIIFFNESFNKGTTEQKKIRDIYIFDVFLNFIPKLAVHFPWQILLLSAIVILVSLVGIFQIKIFHDPLTWLPKQSEVRQATRYIDRYMAGSNALEIIIDTGKQDGLFDPPLLKQIEAINAEFNDWQSGNFSVGKVSSITDLLSELNKALHNNNTNKLPDRSDVLAQELLLLALHNSDELLTMVDSNYQKIRITMNVPWVDALEYARVLPEIEKIYRNALGPHVNIEVTGMSALLAKTLTAVIYSTISSYALALIAITLLMFLVMGDIKLGLVAMLPNLYPITIILGIMGYVGIPLDMFTMLIGSIVIGLSVDDTIHFLHRFKGFYKDSMSVEKAIRETMQGTGRAMLFTAIVLSMGFFIFMFSSMSNLWNFGILAGLAIILALLSDFFLTPAILVLMFDKKVSTPNENGISL